MKRSYLSTSPSDQYDDLQHSYNNLISLYMYMYSEQVHHANVKILKIIEF